MENFVALPQEQMICVYGGDKAAREKRRAARKARRKARREERKQAVAKLKVEGGTSQSTGPYGKVTFELILW